MIVTVLAVPLEVRISVTKSVLTLAVFIGCGNEL
jgi:hypothetical protein